MPGDFQMMVDAIGGVLLVTLSGDFDDDACVQVEDCLQSAVRGRRAVVVDMEAVDGLPERLIHALAAARERLGVRLRLVAPRGGPANHALRAAGVVHSFAVHNSGPVALSAARR
jgi:anti-anti-sigma regulatory factor